MNSLANTTATTYEILTDVQTVDNYPWGFKMKTEQRYWIEYKPKMGFRFMSQTKNPKNGAWCKPKGSTYYAAGFMYKDAETGYIKWWASSLNGDEDINSFINMMKVNTPNFTDEQSKSILGNILFSVKMTAKYLKDVEAYRKASAFNELAKLFTDNKNVSELANINFDLTAIKAIEKNY